MPLPKRLVSREEIAQIEVGHTQITRAMAWVLVAVFLVTIGAVPILQHIHDIRAYLAGDRDSPLPQAYDIFRSVPKAASEAIESQKGPIGRIMDGNNVMLKDIHEFEDALEDSSVVAQAILPPAQYAMTGLFGAGNEEAYLGRNGWLFYRPEVDYVTGHPFLDARQLARRAGSGTEDKAAPQPDPRPAILRLRDQLKARGIELIVLPVPSKTVIHPEMFSRRYEGFTGAVENPSFEPFKRDLEAAGVLVFDATDILVAGRMAGEPQFLRTDTHWTPEAMERVTARLAEFIRKNQMLPDAPAAGYRRRDVRVSGTGDIAEMLKLPKDQTLYPPQDVTVHRVLSADGEPWKRNRQADVLVLGDSFCNVFSMKEMNWGDAAGLCEQLSYHLQRPLDKIAINAGGSYSSRQQLAKDMLAEDRLAGKRLVIYEFAMRDLSEGDWKLIDLPEAPKAGTAPPVRLPVAKGELVVEGRIKAIAATPKPATVPYADCVIALQLVDAKVLSGTTEKREFAVYIMGMRNHQWTAAASLAAGQTVRLRLVPWSTVEDQYDGLNRVDLSELAEETDYYWAQP